VTRVLERDAPALPRGTWKLRLKRAGPWIVGLILATWLLYEHVSLVRRQEALARDLQTRVRAAVGGERRDAAVAVVRITDTDYAGLFGARSPLDPAALQRLLAAVMQGRPRLVGVDIDTSDPAFRGLNVPLAWANRIVWARGAVVLCGCAAEGECGVAVPVSQPRRYRYCAAGEDGALAPLDFLGGRNTGAWGLASLRYDEDGTVRRFWPAVAMPRDTYPTFAHTLARRAGASPSAEPDRARFIQYQPLGSTAVFTASQVMAWARENPNYDALRGRIVIVGGSYWSARDVSPTPLGPMPGVDIHANVVESELGGRAPTEAGGASVLGALVVSSLGLLWIFQVLPFGRALRWALLLWIPFTATLGSRLAAGSWFGLWPFLMPIQVLIVLHQVAEQVNVYREAWLERVLPAPGRQGMGPREYGLGNRE